MRIREVFRPMAVTIGPEEILHKAASKMRFHRIGALPVMHGDWLLGIISERDLVRAITDDADMRTALVGEYMSYRPAVISLDADLEEAAEAMRALEARHLPVVDDEKVVGMLSMKDLLVESLRSPWGGGIA